MLLPCEQAFGLLECSCFKTLVQFKVLIGHSDI